MNVGAKVTDKDLGFKNRVRNLQKLNNKSVKAGVLEGSGNEDNGTSLVDVAFYNEYGTSRIPARPFVRIASEKNQQTWANEAEKVVDKIVAGYDANFSILGNTMKENIHHATVNGFIKSGENSYKAKLKNHQVNEIRQSYIAGDKNFGGTGLAKKFGVSETTIYNIL